MNVVDRPIRGIVGTKTGKVDHIDVCRRRISALVGLVGFKRASRVA
jgi:hypothetical protein